MAEPPLTIYVDVDNTLIKIVGDQRIPLADVVAQLLKLKKEGAELFCWSSLGASYAEKVATELRIAECFSGFLPKPHILIDDQSIKDWEYFHQLYPAQVAHYTLAELKRKLES